MSKDAALQYLGEYLCKSNDRADYTFRCISTGTKSSTGKRSRQKLAEMVGAPNARITQEDCFFCHSTTANPDIQEAVKQQGYAIYKLEGCPD